MVQFEPGPLIERLVAAGVEFVVIGGFAVIAHGYVRATRDLDIVPAPSLENCRRLAALLAELGAEQIGVDANLLPNQPTVPAGLAEGGSFQLTTALGRLDILQESDAIPPYRKLAATAVGANFRGHEILVCSLADLVAMKRRAARPQDIADLAALESAHGALGSDADAS